MPMLALKAHYDGHAVVLDEPCNLPASTRVVVIVTDFSERPPLRDRKAAFMRVVGSMKGQLSSTTEFMARKDEEKRIENRSRT